MPYRETFTNVKRTLVHKAIQNLPTTAEIEVQTPIILPVHAACQCTLDKKSSHEPAQLNFKNVEIFFKHQSEEICEQV